MGPVIIETERLNLRAWTAEDAPQLVELLADPEVNRHLTGGPITLAEADAFVVRYERIQRERGWCRWFVEVKADPGRLGGFVGVGCTFSPEVELGWTLRRGLWGQGLATEAARGALDYCFGVVGFDTIVSAIAPENTSSQRVAERLGMRPEGTLELDGHVSTRWVITNPLPPEARPADPRFVTDCEDESGGSALGSQPVTEQS